MWDSVFRGLSRTGLLPVAPKLNRRLFPNASAVVGATAAVLKGKYFQYLTPGAHSESSFSPSATSVVNAIAAEGGTIAAAESDNIGDRIDGIVCDARRVRSINDLSLLFDQMKSSVSRVARGGSVLLLSAASPASVSAISLSPESSAAAVVESATVASAIRGFTRSLSKELALQGVKVNLLEMQQSATTAAAAAVPFFLSDRSAYITGQVLPLTAAKDDYTTVATSDRQYSVQQKRVLLTGAARGIGEQTARLFAAEGAELLLLDHPLMAAPLQQLAAELQCAHFTADVTDASSDSLLLQQLMTTFNSNRNNSSSSSGVVAAHRDGLLDVVIHNAGITRDKTFKRMERKQFDQVMQVNLASIMRLDQLLLSNSGVANKAAAKFVYLSSISGIAGAFGQSNYSCSKSGIMGYVAAMSQWHQQLSRESNSSSSSGLRFNAVAPGFIETEMTRSMPALTQNIARRMNAFQQGGLPIDVAEALLFLSSDAAAAVDGATLRVCGGHLVGA